MKIKIEVPDGKECLGCQSLIPPLYETGCYVCGAFDEPVRYEDKYHAGRKHLEQHIYKCKQCLNAEVVKNYNT